MASKKTSLKKSQPKPPQHKFPKIVEVVVEIPAGSRNKYEFDEKVGVMRLDRVLSSAVFYNFEYGYIEGTRADDGDHTDALVLLAEPTFPGCHVTARPVGGLRMRDDKGDDFKVLCVALGDPLHQEIKKLAQVPKQRLREIEHFFATYKLLEDKHVDVGGWSDIEHAETVLRDDRKRWLAEIEDTAAAAEAGH
jgi:inorganic pyrophosphatase